MKAETLKTLTFCGLLATAGCNTLSPLPTIAGAPIVALPLPSYQASWQYSEAVPERRFLEPGPNALLSGLIPNTRACIAYNTPDLGLRISYEEVGQVFNLDLQGFGDYEFHVGWEYRGIYTFWEQHDAQGGVTLFPWGTDIGLLDGDVYKIGLIFNFTRDCLERVVGKVTRLNGHYVSVDSQQLIANGFQLAEYLLIDEKGDDINNSIQEGADQIASEGDEIEQSIKDAQDNALGAVEKIRTGGSISVSRNPSGGVDIRYGVDRQ